MESNEYLISDSDYPDNLKHSPDPPELVSVLGEIISDDRLAVAIVGTRKPTAYGREMAKKFSGALASAGITIVAGMARGIDTISHQTALDVGGRTIAVLGSGIDVVYPPENRKLYEQISQNGAVLSEFPKGTPPHGPNFLQRNRVISALSLAVVIVEGTRRSGTLSIASRAAEQGREVFAIPGQLTSPQSYVPHYLIENGAQVAKDPSDILEFLRL